MKVFVAGPRVVTKLNTDVESRLSTMISKGFTVLIGDANGVDRLAQQFMQTKRYQNVIVYASNGIARNNLGNWPIKAVKVDKHIKGFEFYARKDKQMAEDADYGFMVWNGKSKGTMNNILNLTKGGKKVLIYLIPHKKFYSLDNFDHAQQFFKECGVDAASLLTLMPVPNSSESTHNDDMEQMTLF